MNFKILIILILYVNIVYSIQIFTNKTCTWEGTFDKVENKNVQYNIEQELEELLDSWTDENWTLLNENINFEFNYECNEFTVTIEREYDNGYNDDNDDDDNNE
ncbi:11341_t:CDS:1 [Scutellospora calospora]|uniref:11341_t:CDS:1 n=1 Tax=Scutellospora calospora TaxID=85575 RepID=A0ACA9JX44_9GLOM|nr:11341_t:CDS:1 [Scutellospora calospora]